MNRSKIFIFTSALAAAIFVTNLEKERVALPFCCGFAFGAAVALVVHYLFADE